MWLNTVIVLNFLFFSLMTWAQTTTTPVTGTTPVTVPSASVPFVLSGVPTGLSVADGFGQANNTILNLYGGAAGDVAVENCASPTASSTCDNCGISGTNCNSTRIHPALNLNLPWSAIYTPTSANARLLVFVGDTTASEGSLDLVYSDLGVSSNINVQNSASGTVVIPWSTLCAKIGGQNNSTVNIEQVAAGTEARDPTCDRNINVSGRLLIGIDLNGNNLLDGSDVLQTQYTISIHYRGYINAADTNVFCQDSAVGSAACNFTVFPGDKKVYVDDVNALSSFSRQTYRAIRFFYSTTPGNPSPTDAKTDLLVATNGSASSGAVPLQTNTIEGLVNGTTYYFTLATLDVANNVLGFKEGLNTCFDSSVSTTCHQATPDEVIALTQKEFDCFIATAAFGSPQEAHVADFRAFRNKLLHPFTVGRWLINSYYRYSPPVARLIKDRPLLKTLARGILTPIWAIAKGSLWVHGKLLAQDEAPPAEYPYPAQKKAGRKGPDNLPKGVEKPKKIEPSGEYHYDEKRNAQDYTPADVEKPVAVDEEGVYYYKEGDRPLNDNTLPGLEKPASVDGSGEYYYDTNREVKDYTPPEVTKPSVVNGDGSYGYVQNNKDYAKALYLRLGAQGPYPWQSAYNPAVGYKEIYSDRPEFILNVDYEWKLFDSLGTFLFKFGSGVSFTQGRGRFRNVNTGVQPRETFQLLILPNTATLSYKFEGSPTQWVTPFVDFGLGYFTFVEQRSDNDVINFGGAFVGLGSAGLLINLDRFGLAVDAEEGYTRSWFLLMFRQHLGLDQRKDFTSSSLTAGIAVGW